MKRSINMDLARCFALFCVISVHFFLNNGFYDLPIDCARMYIMTIMRTFFIICVPLFMILSGYLLKNKKPCKDYYKKAYKTLAIYVLASLACVIYNYASGNGFSIMGTVWGILNFSAAPYSWYIEMYLGLFLLIPFLNVLYNNLESQRQKQWLVVTMMILTALPSVLNIFQFLNFGWWLQPSISNNYDIIFPDWWVGIYPLTYYFIGAYLREYPIKIKISSNLILCAVAAAVFGIFNCYRSYGNTYIWGEWVSYSSLFTTIQAVLVFNLFVNMKFEKVGDKVSKVFAKLSDWCLGAYLCSWIFDKIFYGILNAHEPNMHLRLEYFPVIVPAVFVCSLLMSGVLNLIYSAISNLLKKIRLKNTQKTKGC